MVARRTQQSPGAGLHKAQVTGVTGNTLTVLLAGATLQGVPHLASYLPVVGDVVAVLQAGGQLVAIGTATADFNAGMPTGEPGTDPGDGGPGATPGNPALPHGGASYDNDAPYDGGTSTTLIMGAYANVPKVAGKPAPTLAAFTALRTLYGAKLLVRRSHADPGLPVPIDIADSPAAGDAAANVVSFLSVTPDAANPGSDAARLRSLAASMPRGSFLALYPDPEAVLSPAAFTAMFNAGYAAAKSGNAKVHVGAVYLTYEWAANESVPDPEAWMPAKADWLGADSYMRPLYGRDGAPRSLYQFPDHQRWHKWAATKGLPLIVAEAGVETVFSDAQRASYYTTSADWMRKNGYVMLLPYNGVSAVTAADWTWAGNGRSWPMTSAAIAQLVSAGKADAVLVTPFYTPKPPTTGSYPLIGQSCRSAEEVELAVSNYGKPGVIRLFFNGTAGWPTWNGTTTSHAALNAARAATGNGAIILSTAQQDLAGFREFIAGIPANDGHTYYCTNVHEPTMPGKIGPAEHVACMRALAQALAEDPTPQVQLCLIHIWAPVSVKGGQFVSPAYESYDPGRAAVKVCFFDVYQAGYLNQKYAVPADTGFLGQQINWAKGKGFTTGIAEMGAGIGPVWPAQTLAGRQAWIERLVAYLVAKGVLLITYWDASSNKVWTSADPSYLAAFGPISQIDFRLDLDPPLRRPNGAIAYGGPDPGMKASWRRITQFGASENGIT